MSVWSEAEWGWPDDSHDGDETLTVAHDSRNGPFTTRTRFQVWVDTTAPLDDDIKQTLVDRLVAAFGGYPMFVVAECSDEERIT